MGISSSSLLDESKSTFVRGRADAELKDFSTYYKRQYLVALFSKVRDEVEQKKVGQTQLLKQREPPKPAEVLYEENMLFFDDTRKWKERLVVVRANYSLECHDNYETFVKGVKPRHKLLPTGGTVLTSEETYMVMVDKLCPDLNNVKEEFAPPMATMPGQFPVYLRLPFRRDSYFCFRQEARRTEFISILNDCIRHQNQDFLRKTACEVQAFRKAIRFYRQEKGLYDSWDMLIGSDVRVLANLVMEKLLPTLQTEMLPRLKGKKTDRKKAWFATVEAAYVLVQEELLRGLTTLKQECRATSKQQEALIRSNMDQIINSQDFLAGKLRAVVTEPAAKFCSEHVRPHLAPVLEELMGPVSTGFQETQALCEKQMSQLCQDFQEGRTTEELKLALKQLQKSDLQNCYAHVDVLHERLQELHSRYGFCKCTGLMHSTQIDMQQLMGSAVHTFEQLLFAALKDNPAQLGSAMEKAKHRVLKQYDYDSSTVRKRLFQEALLDMTLPAMKKNLAPACKPELQAFDQYIFADNSNFIQVENVYEDILLQMLECEVSKVVNEAASLKKHNLFLDRTDLRLTSQSSLNEGLTPPGSMPSSPARSSQSQSPDSPLLGNGKVVVPEQRDTSSVTELVENVEKLVTGETVNGDTRKAEAEEITSGTSEADNQVTSEDKTVIPPNPPSVTETEEVTPNSPEIEQESKQNTVEAEKEVSTDETADSVAEVEKEDTPCVTETEDNRPGATEAKEDTPIAAQSTDEDMIHTAEAKQEDIPCVCEIPAETVGPAALPSLSTDSAGKENHEEDSMVTAGTDSPIAEAVALVTDEAKESEVSDVMTDQSLNAAEEVTETGAPSSSCPNTEAPEINVDSPEAKVMPAEDCEVGDSKLNSTDPTEEVTESSVSLSAEPMAEAAGGDPETLDVGPASQATETERCVDPGPTPEEVEEGAVSLGDKPAAEPMENMLPAEVHSPTVGSPAKAMPAEEPEQVKAPALDCVKEIRDLVVEVIEVEEMVQHYPHSDSS